jgi:hypothetical protein
MGFAINHAADQDDQSNSVCNTQVPCESSEEEVIFHKISDFASLSSITSCTFGLYFSTKSKISLSVVF